MSAGKPNKDNSAAQVPWRSCAMTHTGKVRKLNEDSFLDRPETGLWVVADGMGGHRAGDVASRMIIDKLAALELPDSLSDAIDRIEDGVTEANRELYDGRAEAPGGGVSGSTVAVLIADRLAENTHHIGVCLWAGDSRLYRYRRNQLQQISTDHSQVEEYVRQGRITRDEAENHPEGNVITRAVGTRENITLDADLCEMYPGDRFMLCTDGLMKHMRDAEIAEILAETDVEQACTRLVETTLERGAGDNTTVILVDVT